jgi:hypothetical protein
MVDRPSDKSKVNIGSATNGGDGSYGLTFDTRNIPIFIVNIFTTYSDRTATLSSNRAKRCQDDGPAPRG